MTSTGVLTGMHIRSLALLAIVSTVAPQAVLAQGIVVDGGQFAVSIDGRAVGNEDFVIRRAGLGRADAVFANGVVSLVVDGVKQEVKPLLRTTPPDGVAESYQVDVTGLDAMSLRLTRVGRRYRATISSDVGEEDREFLAHGDTHILELGVAHHYYFLRFLGKGQRVHLLEPRSRRQVTLTAGESTEEELRLGPNIVSARRVEFTADEEDTRTVWFDRQGRVLRVEIPSLGYLAERTDLVG